MAVKWAVANGNWSAGATWNGGSVPQVGDEVYANGHTITMNVDVNIGQGILRNGSLDDYNINSGGYFNPSSGNRIVIAKAIAESGFLFGVLRGDVNSLSVIGDCEANVANVALFRCDSSAVGTCNGSVTGNIHINNGAIFNSRNAPVGNFIITGNVFIGNGSKIANYNGIILNINGNLTDYNINTNTIASLSVVNLFVSQLIVTDLTINGSITYKSTNNTIGVRYTTLNILNPDTFTWKDVTEPRSNPFIIVTDAEMNNRQQYPLENEVKQGTEYVWGEKVGTYQQPPESVVLKGYVYDNGDKEGTLENEVIVDSTNTINVYPYKRRR